MKLYVSKSKGNRHKGLYTKREGGGYLSLCGLYTTQGHLNAPDVVNNLTDSDVVSIGEVDWRAHIEVMCEEVGHDWVVIYNMVDL